MHFFYGLGAFISPMIASPFLLNIDCSPFIDGYTITPPEHSAGNQSVTINPQPKVVNRAMHLSHSKEAFFILGSIQVILRFEHISMNYWTSKWYVLVSYRIARTLTSFLFIFTNDKFDYYKFKFYFLFIFFSILRHLRTFNLYCYVWDDVKWRIFHSFFSFNKFILSNLIKNMS
jgi:hypothetical protein